MYLLGAKTMVRTDQKAITFFNKCRFTNDRLMQWILAIQDFAITFEHLKGKNNGAADYLSRYAKVFELEKIDPHISIMNIFYTNPYKKILKKLKY